MALKPMEEGVDHAIGPLELTVRQFGHPLDDGVTVALPLTEDGEDEGCGRGGDEVFLDVDGRGIHAYGYNTLKSYVLSIRPTDPVFFG